MQSLRHLLNKNSHTILKGIRRSMGVEVDEIIDIYRTIAKFPSIDHARIVNGNTHGQLAVHSQWSQRDLERSEKVKFTRSYIVQPDDVVTTPPHEINEQWNRESPSGKLRAIIRKTKNKKGDEKQFIEIWNSTEKVHCIDVKTLEQHHGSIYDDDAAFGCLEWSPSEKRLLYVAEKKEQDTKSYFDKKAAGDATEGKTIVRGDEFVYKESWGELLTTKVHSVVCVLDVETCVVTTLESIPNGVSPGQAVWCGDDAGIVCVGWEEAPYRLGVVYCPTRWSKLYHIDMKSSLCCTIGDTDKAVTSPVFSEDYSKLAWLQNEIGGPHHQCSKLMMCDWSSRSIVLVVDIVRRATAGEFPGIFTLALHRRCWANDNRRLLMQTQWRSTVELVVIDTETKFVTRLTETYSKSADNGSWQLLDVCNDLVVAAFSSPNQPQHLVIGELPRRGEEAGMKWRTLDQSCVILEDIEWKVFPMSPCDTSKKTDGLDYECYLMGTAGPNCKVKPPLAVFIHGGPHYALSTEFMPYLAATCRCGYAVLVGGPHSVLSTEFMPYLAATCRCGYAVLVVNFRGSTGFGQDGIESLLGNIGTQDVKDVHDAVKTVLGMDVVDKDKVVLIGGSHGGFLTAHLIGQFPEFYKAAICRNPAIDLCTMVGTTDIPDWAFSESGMKFTHAKMADPQIYEELWKRSPIRYVDQMKTPVMIMLGADDRRVPNQQGHLLRKALQARGVTVRTLCYPDNSHPIVKVDSEADAFVNIIRWFNKYTQAA